MANQLTYSALVVALALPAAASAQQAEENYFMERATEGAPQPQTSDGNAEGSLGSRPMRRANRVASQVLRRRMAVGRADDLTLLDEARTAEVIVLRGDHDRVQDVLTALEVDHVTLPPHLIRRLPLMVTQTLMVNCAGRLGRTGTERVSRHVSGGGLLVTTDWALTLASRAFPETIRRGGRNTRNDVVDVEVVNGGHPLMEHVHSTEDTLRWWLEADSYPIDVVDGAGVEVLLASEEMGQRYGRSPVVVTFPYGEGRVLHSTSHFFLQQSRLKSVRDRASATDFARDLGLSEEVLAELREEGLAEARVGEVAGAYAMQQLLTNAIVEKRRENEALLLQYELELTSGTNLREEPSPDSESVAELREGFLLRELERQGPMVRVRDLFGREGWVPAADTLNRLEEASEEETDEGTDAPIELAMLVPTETASEAATCSGVSAGSPLFAALWLGSVLFIQRRRKGLRLALGRSTGDN